jgi:hypothetical protein
MLVNLTIPEANLRLIITITTTTITKTIADDVPAAIPTTALGALKSVQPTISLEMPVPSQGHYGFHSFPVVD